MQAFYRTAIYLIILGVIVAFMVFFTKKKPFKKRKVPLPNGGQGIPMNADGSSWSPMRSVEMLYYSMFGSGSSSWWNPGSYGTDEAMLFMTLADKTQDQLAGIINAYEDKYERDLIADFKGELSGAELSRALDYFGFLTS